ncbi:MAG: class I SAM-dependent methyltransferase [Gemmatimonadaceae bacterium]
MSPQLIEEPRIHEIVPRAPRAEEYERFGNVEARNGLQERLEIPLLLRTLRPPLGARVLEVGCGRGIALPVLAERLRPTELVGVDIDPMLVAIARHRLRASGTEASVLQCDVRALPFEADSFDLVMDFGTCYHVGGGTAGARAALREIARVLCPGGLFIHETPVAQHLAHPVRSFGRRLPWATQPALVPERRAVLWSMRRKAVRESSDWPAYGGRE